MATTRNLENDNEWDFCDEGVELIDLRTRPLPVSVVPVETQPPVAPNQAIPSVNGTNEVKAASHTSPIVPAEIVEVLSANEVKAVVSENKADPVVVSAPEFTEDDLQKMKAVELNIASVRLLKEKFELKTNEDAIKYYCEHSCNLKFPVELLKKDLIKLAFNIHSRPHFIQGSFNHDDYLFCAWFSIVRDGKDPIVVQNELEQGYNFRKNGLFSMGIRNENLEKLSEKEKDAIFYPEQRGFYEKSLQDRIATVESWIKAKPAVVNEVKANGVGSSPTMSNAGNQAAIHRMLGTPLPQRPTSPTRTVQPVSTSDDWERAVGMPRRSTMSDLMQPMGMGDMMSSHNGAGHQFGVLVVRIRAPKEVMLMMGALLLLEDAQQGHRHQRGYRR